MNKSNRVQLATKLKVLRAERGLTQGELANISGVSKCTIVFIEGKCERSVPRMETLIKLANALGVEQNVLLKYIN